jgi:hypothetical protein
MIPSQILISHAGKYSPQICYIDIDTITLTISSNILVISVIVLNNYFTTRKINLIIGQISILTYLTFLRRIIVWSINISINIQECLVDN